MTWRSHRAQVASLSTIIAFCLLVSGVWAVTISAEPSSVSVQPGSTTDVKIIVDELPNGISGYDAKVTLTDPSVARIGKASFPSWAILSNITRISSASVVISGVDLNGVVQPGSTDVLLATITVEGITSGTTQVAIANFNVDDRNGTDVNALPASMVAAVSGNANSGGESYSGGGGGGSGVSSGGSSSSGAADAGTATETRTTTAVSAAGTPVDNKQNGNANQVSATIAATLGSGQQAPSAGAATPSANTGIPGVIPGSMVIIAIIIAIIAAAGLLYFTHKKKL
jgi:hypothetical protein